jgi:hypothetical protein
LAAVQLQFSSNVAVSKLPSQTLAGLHSHIDCIWTSSLPQLNYFPAAIQVIQPLWCLCTELELVLPALRSRSHWPVATVSLLKFLSHYYDDETSNHLKILLHSTRVIWLGFTPLPCRFESSSFQFWFALHLSRTSCRGRIDLSGLGQMWKYWLYDD